jgi:hypothetical protein
MVMVDKKGLGIFVYMVDFICIGSISCIVDVTFEAVYFFIQTFQTRLKYNSFSLNIKLRMYWYL